MNHRIYALALIALWTVPPVVAEDLPLGRLFFTPQQRATLDRQRLYDPNPRAGLERESSYTINGEVRRSNGQTTRWINGEAEAGSRNPALVGVGDTYHPSTGERQDILRGGQLLIRRSGKALPP